jgi:hypothetical protein
MDHQPIGSVTAYFFGTVFDPPAHPCPSLAAGTSIASRGKNRTPWHQGQRSQSPFTWASIGGETANGSRQLADAQSLNQPVVMLGACVRISTWPRALRHMRLQQLRNRVDTDRQASWP